MNEMFCRGRHVLAALLLFALVLPANPAGTPAPIISEPGQLPASLSEVHLLILEVSWNFGDVAPPDWCKELVEDDPTATFRLRWYHSGPSFDHAVLSVYDVGNNPVGEVPLPAGTPAGDGYRYTQLAIGDLPGSPTLTMQVRLKDGQDVQVGSASNEVQITEPSPADPFLYTPIFMIGLATDYGIPGIGGAVYGPSPLGTPGQRVFYDGVRRFNGGPGAIALYDRWHIGSDTKAMTTTVLGWMIEQGYTIPGGGFAPINWDTPVAECFPEWTSLHARFNATTLRHLACHRSGMRMTKSEDAETRVKGGANGNPRTFRNTMTFRLLSRQHYELDDNGDETGAVTAPGTTFFYGSGNYLVLGAVIEKLTNKSYEQAMHDMLFTPAGMTSAEFGMPVDIGYQQPNGHRRDRDLPHWLLVDNTELPPIWNPAGGVYLSLQDWIKFLRLHLGNQVGSLALAPGTLTDLHTMYPPAAENIHYGFGWGIENLPGGVLLGHDGTYGRFYARCSVDTEQGIVVCVAVNQGPDEVKNAGGDIVWEDKAPINAVGALHDHLKNRAEVQADRTAFFWGSIAAGSLGREGILTLKSPNLTAGLLVDHLYKPFSNDPATLLPVSFYPFDGYHRILARAARAPLSREFVIAPTGLFRLQFSGENGAIYQLWNVRNLAQPGSPTLVGEALAQDDVVEFEVAPETDVPAGFYYVEDLEQ